MADVTAGGARGAGSWHRRAMPIAALALRAYLRYLVPLTLLCVLAALPALVLAGHLPLAHDVASARAQLGLGWALACMAWALQVWVVAAVAPAVRGVARGAPPGQLRAFVDGLRGLVRGAVPCGLAVCAILLGGVALVVPGLILLGLLSLTGASEALREPVPAALEDSVATARAALVPVAVVVGVAFVAGVALGAVGQLSLVRIIPLKPPAAVYAACREYVRIVAVAVALGSALPACTLAAVYMQTRRN